MDAKLDIKTAQIMILKTLDRMNERGVKPNVDAIYENCGFESTSIFRIAYGELKDKNYLDVGIKAKGLSKLGFVNHHEIKISEAGKNFMLGEQKRERRDYVVDKKKARNDSSEEKFSDSERKSIFSKMAFWK